MWPSGGSRRTRRIVSAAQIAADGAQRSATAPPRRKLPRDFRYALPYVYIARLRARLERSPAPRRAGGESRRCRACLSRVGEMIKRIALLSGVLLVLSAAEAQARGVTPYLPLNLDPEIEREVERVLILGDKPVMTRPIPAAVVLDALPQACKVDAPLCERVRKFLQHYMHNAGVEFASVEGAITSGSSNAVMPNQHGEAAQSSFQVAGAGYVQPSDYA